MAEAIGLAASLGGLISLGLSVCKGLTEYYSSYKSAEINIKFLCEEVNNLTQTLQSFEDAMKDSNIISKLETSASRLIEACKTRITELDNELKKFTITEKDRRRSVRKVMSRAVRALYPFQEDTLRKLRENISRANEILQQAASSVLIRQNNKMYDTIDRFYEREESKEIIRWLDPPRPSQSHAIASSKRREEETGSWFINSLEFSEWKSSPYSVLWLYGGAGCGKTVLCSTIINHLIDYCKNQSTSGIAYFYFDSTNHSISQDHSRLLRSIIEQLSSQNGSVPTPLKILYERCRNGTTQPSETELAHTLRNIIQLFSPCYLVIDAVDESKEKQEFLKLLNVVTQWRLPQIHFLLTSRTELDTEIPKRSWNSVTVSVEEHVDADVQKHVLVTLQEDDILNQWDPSQRKIIAMSLIDAARGNFRWVACQLQALRECHTLEELEEALGSLPATLEETYERALLAVEEKRMEGFRHILRWLSFSARPMQLGEVAEVLAIDFSTKPRPLYDPRRRFVNSARFFHKHSNLVSILTVKTKGGQHQELRLAHLSVRDYLLSKKIVASPVSYFTINKLSAHRSIAEACIVYLQRFEKPDELGAESLDAHSLARYAARFWSYHVQAATAAAVDQRLTVDTLSTVSDLETAPLIFLIIEFLLQISRVFGLSLPISQEVSREKDILTDLNRLCVELLSAQLQSQIRFFDPDTPWIDKPNVSRSINVLPSALYYAAHAGLTDSVRELLAQGMNVNATGGRYGTPLQAASCKGYRDVIALLLENGADVNLFGGDYGYALQGACCYGHEQCVKLLLDHGANVNVTGGEHHTALHAAAFNGHEPVVETLVQNGAEIDVAGPDDLRTPLIEAAAEGHTVVVELLLKVGANILAKDSGGWTALDESAPPGFDSVVRALIEHNPAILESRDARGKSALHHTAGQHHISTITLLLELGMEANAKDNQGRSALYQATKSGNKAIVELLLKFGAEIFSKDRWGWTVLHMAAFHGHAEVGELFLERGAEINDGPRGWTPLHIAVLKKNIEFVELLLEHNADINVMTHEGLTALNCITPDDPYKAEAMARRLKIDSHNLTLTGLRFAASRGHDARIRELLERGADINAKDEGGLTALMWATMKDWSSTMRLLIENGADVNARNDEGKTAMDYFSGLEEDLNALLFEHGYKEEQSTSLVDTLAPEDLLAREALSEIRELITERMSLISS